MEFGMQRKKMNKNKEDSLMPIATGKVEAQWKKSKNTLARIVCVPIIELSGFWLHHYGFKPGSQFKVYAESNRLVIKAAKAAPSQHNRVEGKPLMKKNIVPLKSDKEPGI